MSFLNSLLRSLFDLLLAPFRTLPPLVGLVVLSLVTAVVMLLVVKVTSNQAKIEQVKRRIHASLFEIRLFNDDLRAIVRAQFHILGHNVTYVGLTLVPLLWMIVPLTLVIAQLQFHYGYRGLTPGDQALVKVELVAQEESHGESGSGNGSGAGGGGFASGSPDWATPAELPPKPVLRLETPQGLRVETEALWIPSLREMTWRIAAESPGDYEIRVLYDGETFTKSVRVSDAVVRRSPVRSREGFWSQLLYPAEDALPKEGPLESITLTYPEGTVGVLGQDLHWMVVFFVLSIALAFAFRKPLNVTI